MAPAGRGQLVFLPFNQQIQPTMKPRSNTPTTNGTHTTTTSAEARPIADILADLRKPIPRRLLKEKPASNAKGAPMLTFCPWYRVQRILNHYAGGRCSYEVRERAVTGQHILMTVRITIHAKEGDFYRDGTGLERLDVDSYGDPQSNAESMAFRRAAARFGLGLHLYEGDG